MSDVAETGDTATAGFRFPEGGDVRAGGGLDGSGNFFNTVRELIDDIHGWHHTGGPRLPALAGFVAGVHVHDELVVIDKAEVVRPTHSKVGGKAAEAAPGPRRRLGPRRARLARQVAE